MRGRCRTRCASRSRSGWRGSRSRPTSSGATTSRNSWQPSARPGEDQVLQQVHAAIDQQLDSPAPSAPSGSGIASTAMLSAPTAEQIQVAEPPGELQADAGCGPARRRPGSASTPSSQPVRSRRRRPRSPLTRERALDVGDGHDLTRVERPALGDQVHEHAARSEAADLLHAAALRAAEGPHAGLRMTVVDDVAVVHVAERVDVGRVVRRERHDVLRRADAGGRADDVADRIAVVVERRALGQGRNPKTGTPSAPDRSTQRVDLPGAHAARPSRTRSGVRRLSVPRSSVPPSSHVLRWLGLLRTLGAHPMGEDALKIAIMGAGGDGLALRGAPRGGRARRPARRRRRARRAPQSPPTACAWPERRASGPCAYPSPRTPRDEAPAELVLVLVKTYDTAAAAELARPLVGPDDARGRRCRTASARPTCSPRRSARSGSSRA